MKISFALYKFQSCSLKVKCVFMQDNASHVSKLTREFFEKEKFRWEKVMEWPPSNSDLNLIKYLWSIVKMKLYECGKQYNSKVDL